MSVDVTSVLVAFCISTISIFIVAVLNKQSKRNQKRYSKVIQAVLLTIGLLASGYSANALYQPIIHTSFSINYTIGFIWAFCVLFVCKGLL